MLSISYPYRLPTSPSVVIKQPMDLGTVRKKLESRTEYKKVDECVADIRLVWSNAMLYNAPGSPIYKLAKSLSDFFESQRSMHASEDAERPPTNEQMQQWAENCHKIGQDELGKMLSVLESACPQSLLKRHDVNEVEVNVDLIGGKAFREVSDFVANLLSKKRKQAGV